MIAGHGANGEPRCWVARVSMIAGPLILAALAGLAGGWLYLARVGQAAEVKMERHAAQLETQERQLQEIRADVKELLRRVPAGGGR